MACWFLEVLLQTFKACCVRDTSSSQMHAWYAGDDDYLALPISFYLHHQPSSPSPSLPPIVVVVVVVVVVVIVVVIVIVLLVGWNV
jgi:hypothetical protein